MASRRSAAAAALVQSRTGLATSSRNTLQSRFDPYRNHLTTIRLALATTVAVVHAWAVGFGHQPEIGSSLLGDLAVDAFFVLSGFLIARSYLRLRSVRRYIWHRFLRIMPGFWVCLLLTAFVAAPLIAWLQGRAPASVFSGQDSAGSYVVQNSALLMRQFGISGLPAGVPVPEVMDGALWTLAYEAVCYAAVVLLAILGGFTRRRVLTLSVIAFLWALTALQSAGLLVVGQERMLRFALMFLLGSAAWIYAPRIPIHGGLAAVNLIVVIVSLLVLPDYRALAAASFAYLCVWLTVIRPPRQVPRQDFSYGMYVYHWPVQQVLVVAGLAAWGEGAFLVVSLAISSVAAFLSWRLVERPALALKDAAWVQRNTSAARG